MSLISNPKFDFHKLINYIFTSETNLAELDKVQNLKSFTPLSVLHNMSFYALFPIF